MSVLLMWCVRLFACVYTTSYTRMNTPLFLSFSLSSLLSLWLSCSSATFGFVPSNAEEERDLSTLQSRRAEGEITHAQFAEEMATMMRSQVRARDVSSTTSPSILITLFHVYGRILPFTSLAHSHALTFSLSIASLPLSLSLSPSLPLSLLV